MPTPKDVHDPASAPWLRVLTSAQTTAILQDGDDSLEGALLAAESTAGATPNELRDSAGRVDPVPRSFVDLITVRPPPLMTITDGVVARTRVPNGSCLWRVDADGSRRVLTYFDGPAWGWRNGRGFADPSVPLGPRATWQGRDFTAAFPAGETDRIGLVAVGDPPPDGFTWTRPGVSLRFVPVAELDALAHP